jgi:inhibitor of cysteine peptidase
MIERMGRRGLVAGLLALVVLVAACSSDGGSSGSKDATVTPANGETITATAQQPFTVKLDSNPTTGYEWRVKNIDGDVKFVESKYVEPKTDAVGAPGEQVLTFDAGPAGSSSVTLVYERPFGDEPPAKTLAFDVDVQKA